MKLSTILLSLFIAFAVRAQVNHPWLGEKKMLVLLLEWENHPAILTPKQINDTVFGNHFSLRQYFLENSNQTFKISGKTTPWYPQRSWTPSNCEPDFIARKAIAVIKNNIDRAEYDSDGDGLIDHLLVVHSARSVGRRTANCFYSSKLNSIAKSNYISTITDDEGEHLPIGLIIHEAGHYLYNMDDHYGRHYHGRYGIGMWGVMGLGTWGTYNQLPIQDLFRYPSHFMPYHKEWIGWHKPVLIERSQKDLEIRPIELGGKIYKIQLGRNSYYLEYRSQNGFSTNHLGHGLLLWKKDRLIQADGRDDLNNGNNIGHRPLPPIGENFGDETDPFGESSGIFAYEDSRSGLRVDITTHTAEKIIFDISIR